MPRPHGILRAGFPYHKTLGMRRVTNFPTDLAFGEEKELYILMRSEGVATVRIWSTDDAEQLTDDLKGFGSYGSQDGQFIWPVNIIPDGDQNLLISDEATNRITKMSPEGEFISKFGISGADGGQFNGPSGIALSPNGDIFVADSKNHRIQVYTSDGEFIDQFGEYGQKSGQLNLPWGIHIDELGQIYVCDWGNNRIQIFSKDGEYLNSFGEKGNSDGQFNRPTGIAVDTHGDIYVSDWGNNRILMFNSEGEYIWSFVGDATLSRIARTYMLTNAMSNRLRETGRLEDEKYIRRPRSVRIDKDFQLFIPDYESYRIQIYKKDYVLLDETQFAPALRNPTLEVT